MKLKSLKGASMEFLNFHDDIKNIRRLGCILAVFGILQFLFIIFLAILFYPGGYNFFGYFLSDLGTVRARNGELNQISSAMFFATFLALNGLLIPFWLILRTIFTNSTLEKSLSTLGSVIGLISTVFALGIGIYPMDTQFEAHEFFAFSYTLLLALLVFFFSIAMVLNQDYSNYVSVISFSLFITIGLFEIINFGKYQAFVQKIIFGGFIFWLLIQIRHVWSFIRLLERKIEFIRQDI